MPIKLTATIPVDKLGDISLALLRAGIKAQMEMAGEDDAPTPKGVSSQGPTGVSSQGWHQKNIRTFCTSYMPTKTFDRSQAEAIAVSFGYAPSTGLTAANWIASKGFIRRNPGGTFTWVKDPAPMLETSS